MIFGQDYNKYDAQGKRHGHWEKRYESGRVRYSGNFMHGKEIGEFYFYKNKIVNNFPSVTKFFDQASDSTWVTYNNIYGKKKSNGFMVGTKRAGTWRYFNDQGKLILLENYKNDSLHGKRVVYYNNGRKAEVNYFKNGKLNGIVSRYAQTGILLSEMTYSSGLLHGRTKTFEVNGDIKESGLYYKDLKIGRWDFYHKGEFMGYREPNKKRTKALDGREIIKAEGEIDEDDKPEKKVYSKELDDKILLALGAKMDKEIERQKVAAAILLNQQAKKRIIAKRNKYKMSDEQILKNLQKKKQVIVSKKKMTDEEILKNINKKKAAEAPKKEVKKLSDQDISKNLKNKNAV